MYIPQLTTLDNPQEQECLQNVLGTIETELHDRFFEEVDPVTHSFPSVAIYEAWFNGMFSRAYLEMMAMSYKIRELETRIQELEKEVSRNG